LRGFVRSLDQVCITRIRGRAHHCSTAVSTRLRSRSATVIVG
jgi:hypothetical protein